MVQFRLRFSSPFDPTVSELLGPFSASLVPPEGKALWEGPDRHPDAKTYEIEWLEERAFPSLTNRLDIESEGAALIFFSLQRWSDKKYVMPRYQIDGLA